MSVGLLTIELRLHDTFSLKDKRSRVKPIVQRLRTRFNVSVSETAAHDVLRRGVISVACVGVSDRHVQGQLQNVVNHLLVWRLDVEVVDTHIEFVA